ncbi:MAG TPA: hypothetical protein VGR97_14625, partial [Candidatus Acidoferrales bacterium]|nr:hypothetical protein [Candidatus Acidoferrales bacterium]
HKDHQSPWQIIERLAPRSPLELCLLPPVFLDYYLNDSGGYDVPRQPYEESAVALVQLKTFKLNQYLRSSCLRDAERQTYETVKRLRKANAERPFFWSDG